MKKYRIQATMTSICYLEIEAEDEDDAWRKGKEADVSISRKKNPKAPGTSPQ